MSTIIEWLLGVMLLVGNVVAVVWTVRARKETGRAALEQAAHRCRHGLQAVCLGFLLTLGLAMWGILQSLSAQTNDEEAVLLGDAISGAMDHTAMLLLAVLIPSACIIYLNVRIRRLPKE